MSPEIYLQWGRPVRGKSIAILWPVNIHTVLVPSTRQRMNLFQDAILGLLATGLNEMNKLADSLDLSPDLIAFIIAQELQPRQWIDDRLRVTPKGMEALGGGAVSDSAMRVMYAFQDVISGKWLPRFAEDLQEIRPREAGQVVRPEFLADRGRGQVIRPYVLKRRPQNADPDQSALTRAWQEYLYTLRTKQSESEDSLLELADQSIEVQDDEPQKAWVLCEVYAPQDDLQPWLVSDPWRLTQALRPLREALTQELSEDKNLAPRILRLVAPDETALAVAAPVDRLAMLDLLAKSRALLEAPRLNKPEHEMMRDYLLRVIRLQESVKGAERVYQEELNSLATQSGALLESTIKWMLHRWRASNARLPYNWKWDELHKLLSDLPLTRKLSDESLVQLSGQAAKQVSLAGTRIDRPFKALFVAALFSTHDHLDHPLREISDSGIDWGLMEARNDSSHASGRWLEKENVLRLAESALIWFKQFESYF